MTSIIPREYSRKAEYVYGINKKEHTLANLGQFEDGNPLNNMQKVFRGENPLIQNPVGHCVQLPHTISV